MKILEKEKSIEKFTYMLKNIKDLVELVNLNVDEKIIKKEWENNRLKFRDKLISDSNFNFLKNKDIGGLMFQGDFNLALKEISSLDEKVLNNTVEYEFSILPHEMFNIDFENKNYNISTNTVHHLYHIKKFLNYKEKDLEVESILEWGAGYGNMAKLCIENFDSIKKYTIIDIPEFILLQYIFLSSYFGEENVRIIKDSSEIADGINLMPVNDIIDKDIKKHDMFISNWAITESTLFCQEYAEKNGFFDYDNLLLSYHQCGNHIPFMNESTALDKKLKDKGVHIEDIKIIPGINYYAFK
mgnify:CR=1 FL=1|tara:strand:+ start:2388 stop:3284 length:897 start_codon:yes stop_codon:yes gene_type:complete